MIKLILIFISLVLHGADADCVYHPYSKSCSAPQSVSRSTQATLIDRNYFQMIVAPSVSSNKQKSSATTQSVDTPTQGSVGFGSIISGTSQATIIPTSYYLYDWLSVNASLSYIKNGNFESLGIGDSTIGADILLGDVLENGEFMLSTNIIIPTGDEAEGLGLGITSYAFSSSYRKYLLSTETSLLAMLSYNFYGNILGLQNKASGRKFYDLKPEIGASVDNHITYVSRAELK